MVHTARPYMKILGILLLGLSFLITMQTAATAAAAAPAKSVAILPFVMHGPDSMAYLQDGLRDMLASRLAANGGAVIVERSKVDSLLPEPGTILTPLAAATLANKLGADYLVTGSLTSLGGALSLGAKVFTSNSSAAPVSFFVSAAGENEVIGAIDKLAWDIAAKLFNITPPQPTGAVATPVIRPSLAAEEDTMAPFKTEHPDRPFRSQGGGQAGGTGSPFIMNQGVAGAQGFTKTRNFDFAVRAMDVGDIDNDGQPDLVLAAADAVHVILRKGDNLQELAVLPLSAIQRVHGISIGDLNNNGRAEIYVSADHNGVSTSFAVEFQDNGFAPLIDNVRWYLRVLDLPGEGPTLIGQRGFSYEEPAMPGIFRLQLNGGNLVPGEQLTLPPQVNLFDFSLADLNSDGAAEIVVMTQDYKLQVLDAGGRRLWQSSEYYGGTSRYIGELDSSMALPQSGDTKGTRIYIPGRIIITDLNSDGRPEVIVNRNISTASRVLAYYKNFDSGEIHALGWNGIGLAELWHTRKIDGYVVDYQLVQQQAQQGEIPVLYAGVVLHGGSFDIFTSKESTVLMYNLAQTASTKE
ncbi:MAG: FG-GAP-like repeat-containing protein [Desulfobulbales bacterium]